MERLQDLNVMSNHYLSRYKAEFASTKNIFYTRESKKKHDWIYIADLNRNILWAEIGYPDWGGN